MKSYFVEEFDSAETYNAFIRYMLTKSDAFSLIYAKNRMARKWRPNVKEIRSLLRPYMIYKKRTTKWASMETLSTTEIYEMVLYRSDPAVQPILQRATRLFEWDDPQFPMDLCFFRNGYAWFAESSHERWDELYIDDRSIRDDLIALGAKLSRGDDIDERSLFHDEHAAQLALRGNKHENDGCV